MVAPRLRFIPAVDVVVEAGIGLLGDVDGLTGEDVASSQAVQVAGVVGAEGVEPGLTTAEQTNAHLALLAENADLARALTAAAAG